MRKTTQTPRSGKEKGCAVFCKFPMCDGTPSPHIVILIAVFLPDLQKQPRKSKFL